MSHTILKPAAEPGRGDSDLKRLYRLGGLGALLAILAFMADIAISFGGADFNPAGLSAVEWFTLFQRDGLSGLRALGLINVLSLTVSLPLYLALYAAHRGRNHMLAALVLILYLLGAGVYIANNAAVPMVVLSSKYAATAAESQQALIAAAGEAVLAKGADFAPGSFIGFFFTEIAGLAFSVVMVRGGVFGRGTAGVGIVGFTLLSVFTIWTTFVPVLFEMAMIVATVGGLSSVAWYGLVARRLTQLGHRSQDETTDERRLVPVA